MIENISHVLAKVSFISRGDEFSLILIAPSIALSSILDKSTQKSCSSIGSAVSGQ